MERLISPGAAQQQPGAWGAVLQPSPAPRGNSAAAWQQLAATPRSGASTAGTPSQPPLFSPRPAPASSSLPPRHPQLTRPVPLRSPLRHPPEAPPPPAAAASPPAGAGGLIRPTPAPASSAGAQLFALSRGGSGGPATPAPGAAAEDPSAEARSPVQLALVLRDPRLPASPAQQAAEAVEGEAGGQAPAEPEHASPQQRRSPPKLIDPVPRMGSLQQGSPLQLADAADARTEHPGSGEAGGAQAHAAAAEESLAGPEWQPEAFLNDFGSEGDGRQAAVAPAAAAEQQQQSGPAEEEQEEEDEAVPEVHASAEQAREAPHAEAAEQADRASSPDMMGLGRGRRGADPAELVTEAIARVTSLCADLDVSDRPRGSQSRHTPVTSPAAVDRTIEAVSPAADRPAPGMQQRQAGGDGAAAAAEGDGESAETISIPRAPGRAAVEEASVGAAAGRAAQQQDTVEAAGEEWDGRAAPAEDPGGFPDDMDGGPEDDVPEQEVAAEVTAEEAAPQEAAAALPEPQAAPKPARPGQPAGLAGSSLKKRSGAAAAAGQGPARAAAAAGPQEHSSGSGQCSTLTSHVGLPELGGRKDATAGADAAAPAASALQAESADAAAAAHAAAGPSKKAKKRAKQKQAAVADAGAGAEDQPQQGIDEEPAAVEEEGTAAARQQLEDEPDRAASADAPLRHDSGAAEAWVAQPAGERAAPKCDAALCFVAVAHQCLPAVYSIFHLLYLEG